MITCKWFYRKYEGEKKPLMWTLRYCTWLSAVISLIRSRGRRSTGSHTRCNPPPLPLMITENTPVKRVFALLSDILPFTACDVPLWPVLRLVQQYLPLFLREEVLQAWSISCSTVTFLINLLVITIIIEKYTKYAKKVSAYQFRPPCRLVVGPLGVTTDRFCQRLIIRFLRRTRHRFCCVRRTVVMVFGR